MTRGDHVWERFNDQFRETEEEFRERLAEQRRRKKETAMADPKPDHAAVEAEARKLVVLLDDPHPGLATWSGACETAFQALRAAVAPELLAENESLKAAVEAARQALGLSPHYGAGQVSDAVRGLVVEVERLRRIREGMERYVPCPDHRDKVVAGECLACQRDTLQAKLNRITGDNERLRAKVDKLEVEVLYEMGMKETIGSFWDALADALKQIRALGGNLSDERLTDRTGPNDAVARGLMYTEARRIAEAALRAAGRL